MYSYSEKDLDRFWTKVDKSKDCWEWTALKRAGYGLFRLNGKVVSAHRLSYQISNNKLDKFILHTCDNPPCVNPVHLFSGTQQDNMNDMYAKGRRQRKKPYEPKLIRKVRKLSKSDIEEILEELRKPYWGQVNYLARKYNVDHSTISHIKTGRYFVS